jgi:hypothetical protein
VFQTIASELDPIAIAVSRPSHYLAGTGSISETILAFSSTSTLSLAVGDALIGGTVMPGTMIANVGTKTGTVTTCFVTVPQDVAFGPMTAMTARGYVNGSIAGTQLSVWSTMVLASSLAAGDVLLGPGIAFGSYISGAAVSGAYPVAVPQFTGPTSTFTALAGEAVAGSAEGGTITSGTTTVMTTWLEWLWRPHAAYSL